MKVFLLEDNPGDVRLIQEMFKDMPGMALEGAADTVDAAFSFLDGHDVDIVLADLNVPDSQGLETLTRLRTRFPYLPIVVITSISDEALGIRAIHLGAQDYLVKGQADGQLMQRAIFYAIERKMAEEALARAKNNLEQEVKDRTRELQVANRELIEQVGLKARAEAELRALSNRVLSMQEEERRNIARELHDQVGQTLTVIKLMLGAIGRNVPEDLKPRLKEVTDQIVEVMRQVRNISHSLRPTVLDDLGLVPGLKSLFTQLKDQVGLEVDFQADEPSKLDPLVSTAAYRIVQEALTNVLRHSGVKQARVRVWVDNGDLRLKVEDAGRGFDIGDKNISTGLSAMRERAALLRGSCDIESVPGKGTVVTAQLPGRE